MGSMDSPGSPLSELSSDDFHEDEHHPHAAHHLSDADHDAESTRPSKRQRVVGPGGPVVWDNLPQPPPEEDISSDSEGSVPGSPHMGAASAAAAGNNDDEDYGGYGHREQVSVCKWDGCPKGDCENMDNLVEHLHVEHIHARQKKYACEWGDCTRKGIPHASGYALRAHMRSHTREKPFYCSLPECDRSFTRSDALAKHMRTVHETEALRPSDPVPKHHSSNPQNKSQKIKLTFKGLGGPGAGHNNANGDLITKVEAPKSVKSNISAPPSPSTAPTVTADVDWEHNNIVLLPAPLGSVQESVRQFPTDIHFSDRELSLPPQELLRALKIQFQYATTEGEQLRKELLTVDERRKAEWIAKELVLENAMESELAIAEKKGPEGLGVTFIERGDVLKGMRDDVDTTLEIEGEPTPWWKEKGKESAGMGMDDLAQAEKDAVDSMVKMERGFIPEEGVAMEVQ